MKAICLRKKYKILPKVHKKRAETAINAPRKITYSSFEARTIVKKVTKAETGLTLKDMLYFLSISSSFRLLFPTLFKHPIQVVLTGTELISDP